MLNFLQTLIALASLYIVLSLLCFLLIRKITLKQVQAKKPTLKDYFREIKYSTSTLIIFSFLSSVSDLPAIAKYTKIYTNVSEYGWGYYFAIIPIMLMMHDLYFYLFHRLIHHRKIFNLIHLTHHKSKTVSPLTAYSLDPLEAVGEQLSLFLLIFLVPIHTTHVNIWVICVLIQAFYIHLGFEVFSDRFLNTRIGKLVYTSTSHANHHRSFKGNYGFYTLIWDKLFKTIRS